MKKNLIASLLFAILSASAAHAVVGTNDNVPAATLLMPYFSVNLASPNPHTVASIGNATSNEVLAHVVLWTDRGVPSFSFDIRLGAYDVEQMDLSTLFTAGSLPQTTAGTFASCTASLPPPALAGSNLTALQNAHRGLASSLFGGNCGGVNHGDNVARGYLTIDVRGECNAAVKFPADAGYFVAGGTGVATNTNALFGEYSVYNTSAGYAHGEAMVAIEASASDPATDGTPDAMTMAEDYTFYRRQIGSAADNRESLPSRWMARFVKSGVFTKTNSIVWRDPGSMTSFACNNPPTGLSVESMLSFDEEERPSGNCPPTAQDSMPYATESIDLANTQRIDVPFSSGFVSYQLNLKSAVGVLGTRNQAFVTQVFQNADDLAQGAAWPFRDLGDNAFPNLCGECTDGIDNDGDGFIDFPNDSGCRDAKGVENPACSDGVDNDGDNKTDYPDDPECWDPLDRTEDILNECDDGIDNDLDAKVDFPNDPRCNSAGSNSEAEGACGDGIDNDMDGKVDFPADTGCSSRGDSNETNGVCADGIDNDMDGKVDYPNDPGCVDGNSASESPQCSDGIDNDGDGKTDFPTDLACLSAAGGNESAVCSDGVDNDMDGFTDFPADPGCANGRSNNEKPECNNGLDDDNDNLADYPADPGCTAASSNNESTSQCSNGRDDDGDGKVDYPNDSKCTTPSDDSEAPACSDAVDNDSDGLVDFPNDPGCASAADNNEHAGATKPQCSDGVDNDGDGSKDYPADNGCGNPNDDLEFALGAPSPVVPERTAPALSPPLLLGLAGIFVGIGFVRLRRRSLAR